MWTFMAKCGQAISIGLMGLILSLSGYVPDAEQGQKALAGIRILLGPIPRLCSFSR